MRKLEITDTIKDSYGNIIGYELNSGSIIDNEQAVYMVQKGELSNVEIISNNRGNEMVQGKGFDLNNIPEIK
jgi:hypothetical protein